MSTIFNFPIKTNKINNVEYTILSHSPGCNNFDSCSLSLSNVQIVDGNIVVTSRYSVSTNVDTASNNYTFTIHLQ